MRAVLDASVTLKWLLRGVQDEAGAMDAAELAWAVEQGHIPAIQPQHWLPEVSAGLVRLSPNTAEDDCAILQTLALPIADDYTVIVRAIQLATDLKHHLFDTLYHAVALEMNAVLITADRRYLNNAHHLGQVADLSNWRKVLNH